MYKNKYSVDPVSVQIRRNGLQCSVAGVMKIIKHIGIYSFVFLMKFGYFKNVS